MFVVPRTPLCLGLLGLAPFIWGALTVLSPSLHAWGSTFLGQRFIGPHVQLFYASIILSFMSGVLWGFSTKAEGRQATIGYGLSVLPALWAFFMTGGGTVMASTNLIAGFTALLVLDYAFWTWGLTPRWWFTLRVLLTSIVVLCLGVTVVL